VLLTKAKFSTEETFEINHIRVSSSTIDVFKKAKQLMENYNQTYISEGHVIAGVLDDPIVAELLGEGMTESIKQIACVPRDLIVYLDQIKEDESLENEDIRKVGEEDRETLQKFIEKEFRARWMKHINHAFDHKLEPSIYVYEENNEIVGFACFDVVRGKKGLFGPMGTAKHLRSKGVGVKLLGKCMFEMKKVGYETAIIGEAGPIEFYQKVLGARVMPRKN